MDLERVLSRYFYIAVDDCLDGEFLIHETILPAADHSYADAKSAIDNATWKVVRLYRINLGLCTVEDVTVNTAIALWHECEAAGEPVSESVYEDFIRAHVPAQYDCGARAVYCPHKEAAE